MMFFYSGINNWNRTGKVFVFMLAQATWTAPVVNKYPSKG